MGYRSWSFQIILKLKLKIKIYFPTARNLSLSSGERYEKKYKSTG